MNNFKHDLHEKYLKQNGVTISFKKLNISEIQKLIINTRFFMGEILGRKIISNDLNNYLVNNIDFPIRFKNSLRYFPKILNLENLLNTDYNLFFTKPNLGKKTIFIVRNDIIEFLSSRHLLNSSGNIYNKIKLAKDEANTRINILRVPFFDKDEITYNMINDLVLEINLKEINFPVRFENYLFSRNDLLKVKDILNISPMFFNRIKNVGRKSIKTAQKILLDIIKNAGDTKSIRSYTQTRYLDDKIIIDIKWILRKERYIYIILKRSSYNTQETFTYERIGKKLKITRERVRQIIDRCEEILSTKDFIFKGILNEIIEHGYVVDITKLYYSLIRKRKWHKTNSRFLKYIIDFLFRNDSFFIDDNYIFLKSTALTKPIFDRILKIIENNVRNRKVGISLKKVMNILKSEPHDLQLELNKLLTLDTIEYLSKKYDKFYVRDNLIYNKTMYYIYFGVLLKDVTFFSLKYLSKPTHFVQLAKFIRENNYRFAKVSDESVHSTLICHDFFRLTGRGTYVLEAASIHEYEPGKESSGRYFKN